MNDKTTSKLNPSDLVIFDPETTKKRSLKNYEFDRPSLKRLAGLKRKTGWTEKAVLQKALKVAETSPQFFNLI